MRAAYVIRRKFCEMLAAGRLRWSAVLPILANAHGV
jgi:hypothetical protein